MSTNLENLSEVDFDLYLRAGYLLDRDYLSEHEFEEKGFFSTVAIVARLFLVGWELTRPNAPTSQTISDIIGKIDAIINSVEVLASNLEAVSKSINELPSAIRGVMKEEYLLQKLSDARAKTDLLRYYMADETRLADNVDNIKSLSDDLFVLTRNVIDAATSSGKEEGKLSALILNTPFYTMLSSSVTYGERQHAVNNNRDPSKAPTIYDHPANNDLKSLTKDIFSKYDALKEKYSEEYEKKYPFTNFNRSDGKIDHYKFNKERGFYFYKRAPAYPENANPDNDMLFHSYLVVKDNRTMLLCQKKRIRHGKEVYWPYGVNENTFDLFSNPEIAKNAYSEIVKMNKAHYVFGSTAKYFKEIDMLKEGYKKIMQKPADWD